MTPRDPEAVRAALLALMPQGWAWSHRPGAGRVKMLEPLAEEISAAETGMLSLLRQVSDPREATDLLPDFERVLGPDSCGRDQLGLGTEDRQRVAHQRWTQGGGASIPFFTGVAAKLGVAISIEESVPTVCGEAECGDELTPEDEVFVWTVHLPTTREIEAECGVTQAGDPMGEFAPSLVECVIRDLAPEHTTVVFSYEAA
jgi:uncharacterized protein YmfQ (DUF2313 family)